jgi:hypothetical protein
MMTLSMMVYHVVCGCVFQGRPVLLDLTHPGRLPTASYAQKLAAVVNGGSIWTSTDAGISWTERLDDESRSWYSIASSSDGMVRFWMHAISQAA